MPQEPIGREILRVNPIVGPRPFFIPAIRSYEVNELNEIVDPVMLAIDSAILSAILYVPVPEVILVSGINYPEIAGIKFNDVFNYNIRNIIPLIVKKYIEVRITVFDFYKGTQTTNLYKNTSPVQPAVVKNLGELKSENYRHTRIDPDYPKDKLKSMLVENEKDNHPMYYAGFTDAWKKTETPTKQEYLCAYKHHKLKERSISIADIYNYMINVPHNSIAEFHIFSHSNATGPILTNTEITPFFKWEKGQYGETKYTFEDPSHYIDKDARWFHFEEYTNLKPDTSILNKKFTSYGFSQIWGCLADPWSKKIINIIIDKKKKNISALAIAKANPDKKVFIFYLKQDDFDKGDFVEEQEKKFHEFMIDVENKPGESDFKSLNDIRAILNREMNSTYMKQLAKISNRYSLGALPGTGGDFDKPIAGSGWTRLMHIDMGEHYGDTDEAGNVLDYTRLLKFYKEYMGIQFKRGEYHEDYGRGYAIYEP